MSTIYSFYLFKIVDFNFSLYNSISVWKFWARFVYVWPQAKAIWNLAGIVKYFVWHENMLQLKRRNEVEKWREKTSQKDFQYVIRSMKSEYRCGVKQWNERTNFIFGIKPFSTNNRTHTQTQKQSYRRYVLCVRVFVLLLCKYKSGKNNHMARCISYTFLPSSNVIILFVILSLCFISTDVTM